MKLSEILGQEKIVKKLCEAHTKGKIPHALLFHGEEGAGALPLALAFSQYVHCINPGDLDSCGQCSSCNKINTYVHPDLHFVYPSNATNKPVEEGIEPLLPIFRKFLTENKFFSKSDWADYAELGNKQLSISVDMVRSIIKRIRLKAYESPYRIVVIWMPELMNASAANAMLKVLEEPGDKVRFLLVTHSLDQVLPTIRSRCQLINVNNIADELIFDYIDNKFPEISAEQKAMAVALGEGNIRKAIKKLTDEEANSFDFLQQWMRFCFSSNYIELVNLSENFSFLGKQVQQDIFNYALFILRQSLLLISGVEIANMKEKDFITKFATTVNEQKIAFIASILGDSAYHIERNADPKLEFFNISLKIMQIFSQK